MTIRDVLLFGAGFGCGALWLGFAFMSGHRLRDCQPPEAPDLSLEGRINHPPPSDQGVAPAPTTPMGAHLRRVLLWALVLEEYAVVALVVLRYG